MMNKNNIWNLAFIAFLVMPDVLMAQNYVYAKDEFEKTMTEQYYDGVGRPTSLSLKGLNTTRKSVNSLIEYDTMGREHRRWLLTPGSQSLKPMTSSSIASLSDTYFQDLYGYSDTQYDVLGRTVFVSTPGQAWNSIKAGKSIEYMTNGANTVKKYKNSNLTAIKSSGYYPASTLTGTKVTDEDGHTIETYKDFLGNVVLERRDGNNDTYYVYDKNRLVMVLPPECQNVTNNSKMVYRYLYDSKGRCIQKTLPGDVIIKYWYDKYDRLAFMQDGLLRASNQYRFYLYDDLSRLVVQGITADASILDKTNFEAKVIYGNGVQAVDDTGYSFADNADRFTVAGTEIVNYYDGYDCLSNPLFDSVGDLVGTIPSVCTTSLMTAQVVATSDNQKLNRVFFYDSSTNITDVQEFRPDGTHLKTSHRFSPTNKPTFSTTSVVRNGETVSVQDSMVYCPVSDKVLEHWQKFGSLAFTKIESYQYDDLGKVKTLSYYDDRLSTHYTYDIHGWTKSINSYVNSTSQLLFGEKLYYADAYGPKCYNGNISEVRWITADNPMGDQVFSGYRYLYDGMNRLTTARSTYGHWVYSDNTNAGSLGIFDLTLTYDANSAIKTLKRSGKKDTSGNYGVIDDLTYTYSNGQLVNVTDQAENTVYDDAFNFIDNRLIADGGVDDYAYNANGAMTRDFNKGITFITYNMFGYPQKVIFANRNSIEYVYSADGIRLKTRRIRAVPQSGAGSSSSSTTNYTFYRDSIDYVGDFEYNRNHFSKYKWENGYVQPQGTSYAYSFYFKDHQGNNRVVTPRTGFVRQTLHYYPDGVTQDKSVLPSVQKYKYNGKELDRMHGLDWYDYGARQYDPTIGQFTSMDPHCEKYYNVSPYVYCHSNPVMRIDPDGKDDWVLRKSGQLILLKIGGEVDNIQYGKKSFSIAHGAFGKTTEKMIGKDFSGRNANFSNVIDGLKFMRVVSNFTGKETQAIGVGNTGRRELIVGAWKNNTIGENAYGTLSNKSNAIFKYDASQRVSYFIHTHPKVSGYPYSGRPKASRQDLKDRTSPTAGYYIMTSENGIIYNYSLTTDSNEELEELRQKSVLY